jgi:hypothetical protein
MVGIGGCIASRSEIWVDTGAVPRDPKWWRDDPVLSWMVPYIWRAAFPAAELPESQNTLPAALVGSEMLPDEAVPHAGLRWLNNLQTCALRPFFSSWRSVDETPLGVLVANVDSNLVERCFAP